MSDQQGSYVGPAAAAEEAAVTIDRPEDAARRDIGDALIGGEVGISRAHADQLAADPPGTDKAPAPPRADAPSEAGGGGSAAAASAPGTPTPGPARTAGPGGR